MKKPLLCFFFFAIITNLYSQESKVFKYWIEFTDKKNNPYSINNPSEFLSERAIQRRIRQGIPVAGNDLPVTPRYVDSLDQLGARVIYTSRWFNAAVSEISDSLLIDNINALPFVRNTQLLYKDTLSFFSQGQGIKNDSGDIPDYGLATNQITIHHGDELHNQGYQGQGMVIAVIDAGFYNTDSLPAFDSIRNNMQILGTFDFVEKNNDVYREYYHGMSVLSLMAGNMPGELIGTAPKAAYWLLRSEDVYSEYRIEEANWIAAAEFADSVGADLINTSLGYSLFDDSLQNYTYADMDGNSTLVTRGADMAASKGILVVVSAGNSGNQPWMYITSPADGDSVLAVGAVNYLGEYAAFSSQGPSYDGRTKPDVVAVGSYAYAQRSNGTIGSGSGTSYASPIMCGLAACLWQKFPSRTNYEIITALQQSSSLYPYPNNTLGYGIPNIMVAADILNNLPDILHPEQITLFPNPVTDRCFFTLPDNTTDLITCDIFDATGKLIGSEKLTVSQSGSIYQLSTPASLTQGLYIVRITTGKFTYTCRFIKE